MCLSWPFDALHSLQISLLDIFFLYPLSKAIFCILLELILPSIFKGKTMTHLLRPLFLSSLMTLSLHANTVPQATHTITIAGTADLQGMLEPQTQEFDLRHDGHKETMTLGGVSRISTLFKGLKEANPSTVTVSTGDDLMNRYFHIYQGRAILSLMSDAGYDLYAVGNHEFDKGSDVLAKALKKTSFKTLCSDLDVTASALKGMCEPYLVRELDGVKVGFFSLMTEDLPLVTSERKVKIISDNITTARKMVALLKGQDIDVIVALSHIGYKADVRLAKQVKGIDLIFGGHSHETVKAIGHVNKTAIVNGGEKGSEVIKVDIPLTKEHKIIRKDIKMTAITVRSSLASDPEIDARIAAYKKGFPATIVLGQTKGVWDMSKDEIRKSESTVANMIDDMMREQFKVDIVLNNAGAFRGQKRYGPGAITDTMLKEIDEFANYAFTLKMKGKYLKAILERSAASYGEGGFLHPSGLKYTVSLPGQPQTIKERVVSREGNRVQDIQVLVDGSWQPLEMTHEYTILSNSFIVNQEGDGYFWFKKYGSDLKNTYTTFYSLMADFLRREKVLTPGEKDGRVKIVYYK